MDTDVFNGRLLPGERVLWSGRPGQGMMLGKGDAVLIPFSLVWGGFAIFWESSVIVSGAPLFFRLWGIPFVLVGLYLMAGRFLHDAQVRRQMHYAVTTSRVLILRNRPHASLTALNLDRLPDLTLRERRDGRGTIMFGQPAVNSRGRRSTTPEAALDPTPKFIAIDNASEVFALLQRVHRVA